MDKERETMRQWFVWVDWNRRIISFHEVAGFDRLEYPTHDEMFHFVIEKGNEGYGIQ